MIFKLSGSNQATKLMWVEESGRTEEEEKQQDTERKSALSS